MAILSFVSDALEYLAGELTVLELARRSGRSVEAIVQWAIASRRPRTSGERASIPAKVKTTTAQGRADFDASLLRAITASGGSARAEDLADAVGGSAHQRLSALKRLVSRKKLKRTGKTRATSYVLRERA